MNWFETIRAYGPAIVATAASLFAMIPLARLKGAAVTSGMFDVLRWAPLAGIGLRFSMVVG